MWLHRVAGPLTSQAATQLKYSGIQARCSWGVGVTPVFGGSEHFLELFALAADMSLRFTVAQSFLVTSVCPIRGRALALEHNGA